MSKKGEKRASSAERPEVAAGPAYYKLVDGLSESASDELRSLVRAPDAEFPRPFHVDPRIGKLVCELKSCALKDVDDLALLRPKSRDGALESTVISSLVKASDPESSFRNRIGPLIQESKHVISMKHCPPNSGHAQLTKAAKGAAIYEIKVRELKQQGDDESDKELHKTKLVRFLVLLKMHNFLTADGLVTAVKSLDEGAVKKLNDYETLTEKILVYLRDNVMFTSSYGAYQPEMQAVPWSVTIMRLAMELQAEKNVRVFEAANKKMEEQLAKMQQATARTAPYSAPYNPTAVPDQKGKGKGDRFAQMKERAYAKRSADKCCAKYALFGATQQGCSRPGVETGARNACFWRHVNITDADKAEAKQYLDSFSFNKTPAVAPPAPDAVPAKTEAAPDATPAQAGA